MPVASPTVFGPRSEKSLPESWVKTFLLPACKAPYGAAIEPGGGEPDLAISKERKEELLKAYAKKRSDEAGAR